MKRTFQLAAAFALIGSGAMAELNTDAAVQALQDQGYTRIEVRTTATETKVEAIRGTEKVEITYDSATGAVLKTETARVRAGEDTTPGVSLEDSPANGTGTATTTRTRTRAGDDDAEDDDNHGDQASGNDDQGNDDHASGNDDHGDDDHGDDDHGDDDHGNDDHGNDDHGNDDHDGGSDD